MIVPRAGFEGTDKEIDVHSQNQSARHQFDIRDAHGTSVTQMVHFRTSAIGALNDGQALVKLSRARMKHNTKRSTSCTVGNPLVSELGGR